MFRPHRVLVLSAGLLCLIAVTSTAVAWQLEPASEADLLATLQSPDASDLDKALACKRLGVVGTDAAVPVLAGMLGDPKFSHYARYGLEPIPSSKVDDVLRQALSTLEGRHLRGVIQSIGNRNKPESLPVLADKLDDADRDVAGSAAHAIARIGTPAAGEILGKTMSREFAPACLVCGKTLAEQGHVESAILILVELSKLEATPQHIRDAATLQAIVLRGEDGLAMLSASLTSADKAALNTALRTARLVEPALASQAVRDALQDSPPAREALLVTLLGDLGDPAGLDAAVEAAGSDNAAVRVAALKALASLGNAEHVSLLFDAAGVESEEVSAAARNTLAALPGEDVDAAVLGLLDDPTRQAAVIQLVGQRRITRAVPKLLGLIEGPNKLDVILALGETVSLQQLDVLGKLLADDSEEVRQAAREAVHAACYRMTDRDATATALASHATGASDETLAFIMEELRVLGGEKALSLVAEAASNGDPVAQDYATRALGEWLDTSVAPVLLDLAKTEGESKFGIRAVRGYIRLIRQFSMSDDQRALMCRVALKTATRDAEKKLVLEVLQRYPSSETMRIAIEASKEPGVKNEAVVAATAIAQQLGGNAAVKALLAEVGHDPVKIEIVKAEYGAGAKQVDVTETLRQRVRGFPLIVLPSAKYNTTFGGDPAQGTPKALTIEYLIDGKPGKVTLAENAPILLPMPK